MYPVKQSTALTVPFFAHDANGDGVTGMVDGGFTKRISKNGAAFGAMTVTITEMENGWYSFPLSTSHTDTNGILSISLSNASCKRVNLQFRVGTKLVDDLNDVAATDIVSAGAITTSSGAVSTVSSVSGAVGSVTGAVGSVTAAVTLPTIPANWITAAGINASALDGKGDWNVGKTGYSLTQTFPTNFADLSITASTGLVDLTQAAADKAWSTAARTLTASTNFNDPTAAAIADAVWDELQSAHVTAGSFGETATEIAAILADTNELQSDDVPGLIAALNDPTAAAIADAVWDELQSEHVTVGSFGEIATEIAAILADTNELQSDDVPGLIAALNDIAATDVWAAATRTLTASTNFNDISAANVLTQVNAALDTAIAELGVGVPTATPTLRTGLMLLYMALRNKTVTQTSGTDALEIHNNAGTKIASKALTDDGSDYTEAKMVSG